MGLGSWCLLVGVNHRQNLRLRMWPNGMEGQRHQPWKSSPPSLQGGIVSWFWLHMGKGKESQWFAQCPTSTLPIPLTQSFVSAPLLPPSHPKSGLLTPSASAPKNLVIGLTSWNFVWGWTLTTIYLSSPTLLSPSLSTTESCPRQNLLIMALE